MAAIIMRRKWTRQPSGLVRPSTTGIASGMKALLDQQSNFDLCNALAPKTDTAVPFDGRYGLTRKYTGGTKQQYASSAGTAITGALTVAVYFDLTSLSNYTPLITKEGTSTSDMPYEIRVGGGSADAVGNFIRASASNYAVWTTGGMGYTAGSSGNLFVVTFADGNLATTPNVWANGASVAVSNNHVGSGTVTDNGADVYLGNRPDGVTFLDGKIYYAAVWNRALDGSEATALWYDPWQLFAPRTRRLYFGAAAGGSKATFLGAGSLAGVGHAIAAGHVAATGTGALSGVGAALARAAAAFTGAGSLTSVGHALVKAAFTAQGAGTLNATGHSLAKGAVAFAGGGALNGVAPRTVAGVASFGGGAALNAVASPTGRGTGDGAKWSRYVIEEFKRQEAARKKREEEEREEQAALPQVAFDVIATRPIVTEVAPAPAARTTLDGIIGRPTVLDVDVELADFREMMSMIAELGQEA